MRFCSELYRWELCLRAGASNNCANYISKNLFKAPPILAALMFVLNWKKYLTTILKELISAVFFLFLLDCLNIIRILYFKVFDLC